MGKTILKPNPKFPISLCETNGLPNPLGLGHRVASRMASHTLSTISYCTSQSCHRNATNTDFFSSSSTLLRRPKPHNLTSSFTGRRLSIRPSSSQRFVSKHRPAIATVLLSLPTLYVQMLWTCAYKLMCMYVCVRACLDVLFIGLAGVIRGNDLFALFSRKPERASSDKTPKWVNFKFVFACVCL